MASIVARKNKAGVVASYKLMCCVGRDDSYKQIWRTKTIPRPEGLTPAKERKEVQRIADEWEEAQKAEYSKTHSKTDKEKITLAVFVREHWWPDHVLDGQHTPSTISFFQYMSNDILDYFGPKKQLRQIDTEAVKRYVKWLRTEARSKTGKPYTASTVQHHFSSLRNILEYARRLHYIDLDPCQDLSQKEKPQRDKKRVDFLAPAEAQKFMEALSREPLYWQALESTLILTGLRRGECVGLQWGDLLDRVDGEGTSYKVLSITRNVTIDKNSPDKFHVGGTKTGESREVPISPRLYALLMAFKREQTEKYGGSLLPSAFIFCRADDPYKPIYPTEPTRQLRKFVKRNNLPEVSPHDLRHTAASLALEGGANLKQVQTLLGHKDPSTTMAFYSGLTAEAERRTVAGIESLLLGKEA